MLKSGRGLSTSELPELAATEKIPRQNSRQTVRAHRKSPK